MRPKLAPPSIDAGYLSSDSDVQVALELVKVVRKLTATRPLSPGWDSA